MGISINLRGKGDMKMSVYDPNKDGIISLAEMESQTASGMYGGNDNANQAIAHGLSAIPRHILIAVDSGYMGQLSKHRNGKIFYLFDAGRGEIVVTNMDTTNFYVGNVGNYFTSMNAGGRSYQWIALI